MIMPPPSCSFKKEILRKWMMCLKTWGSSEKEMSLLERKKAIKLSADLAMASARNGATFWSRALFAKTSKLSTIRRATNLEAEAEVRFPSSDHYCCRTTREKILRKARIRNHRRPSRKCAAILIARKVVKKRTQVLKGLVPGGEHMDGSRLIKETLDYIVSLQAQVHVMQFLAGSYEGATDELF